MLRNINRAGRNREQEQNENDRDIALLPLNPRLIMEVDDDRRDDNTRFSYLRRLFARMSIFGKIFRIFVILLIIVTVIVIFFMLFRKHYLDTLTTSSHAPYNSSEITESVTYGGSAGVKDTIVTTASSIQVCHSEPCKNAANSILDTINETINPCDNFYQFVCGNTKVAKLSTVYEDLQIALLNLMRSLDNLVTKYQSNYISKLHRYYNSCVNDFLINVTDVKSTFDNIGGWPLQYTNKLWKEEDLEWPKVLSKFYRSGLPAKHLIDFMFEVDYSDSTNQGLVLNVPDFYISKEKLMGNITDITIKNYIKFMTSVLKILGIRDVDDDIKEVIKFEMELAKTVKHFQVYEEIVIDDLEKKYPGIAWLELINGILSPYVQINGSKAIRYSSPFLGKFHNLMTKRKPPNCVIINYLFWRSVTTFGPNMLVNERNKKSLERKFYNPSNREDRELECAQMINSDMYLATSALYIRDFDHISVSEVALMSEYLRQNFHAMVEKVTWLNESVKSELLNKISRMDLLIGYPMELYDEALIEEYYDDLEEPSDKFFFNDLYLRKFLRRKSVEEFARKRDNKDWRGIFGNVVELTAKYTAQNAVYLSAGIMHPLFYDYEIPNYMNYAILGETLGHEMSHALSNYFMYFNASGNLDHHWWDEQSIVNFKNNCQCFVDLYSNYTYEEYGLSVNGSTTLDENVADITGVKLAYDVYNFIRRDKLPEARLPGLEKYTPKQMFWIAYASTFCERPQDKDDIENLISFNPHAPDEFRVIGSVTTIPEFFQDFHCLPNDNMRPIKNCSLWF